MNKSRKLKLSVDSQDYCSRRRDSITVRSLLVPRWLRWLLATADRKKKNREKKGVTDPFPPDSILTATHERDGYITEEEIPVDERG